VQAFRRNHRSLEIIQPDAESVEQPMFEVFVAVSDGIVLTAHPAILAGRRSGDVSRRWRRELKFSTLLTCVDTNGYRCWRLYLFNRQTYR